MSLFEDTFEVLEVDPDGKKFEKVARLQCRGESYEMDLMLDVHSDLCVMGPRDRFTLCLARSIHSDAHSGPGGDTVDDSNYLYHHDDRDSLMDKFEYVMFGTVFKIVAKSGAASGAVTEILASFGGLLMSLKGDPRNLVGMEVDKKIYLLLRKTV